jgi:acetylornithine/succinyldiaminopimelate/putrescine aminotransferase
MQSIPRRLFFDHQAPTSAFPLGLEIVKADGVYMYDASGKSYLDAISGISVSNVGHRHPAVVAAIKHQCDQYLHLMVYGEYVQHPTVALAKALVEQLPPELDCVYFTNSGTEATEGAMKLAKRATGRSEIISMQNAYHGSSQGALSIIGNECMKTAFRPLLPDTTMLRYNNFDDLSKISSRTAAVFVEAVQAESGVVLPAAGYLVALTQKCKEVGALLVLDEIQTGMGRTGSLFYFEQAGIVPDVLLTAKGLGGGLPIGAFIASKSLMEHLANRPILGHITTFGGNALCCAAALAALGVVLSSSVLPEVLAKADYLKSRLIHPKIKTIRNAGLLMAIEFESFETNKKYIDTLIENGVITDWFLFNDKCMRIAPPLTITYNELDIIIQKITEVLNKNDSSCE